MRAPVAARRKALAELAQHASAVLGAAGHASSQETMRRIRTTLEALATYGDSPGAPRPGRLTADVDPPGFEALAALVPRSGTRPRRRGSTSAQIIPFRQPKPKPAPKKSEPKEDGHRGVVAQRRARQAELRKVVRDAERTLKDANRHANKVQKNMKAVAARANEMEKRRVV